jgi:hypothetical protein
VQLEALVGLLTDALAAQDVDWGEPSDRGLTDGPALD